MTDVPAARIRLALVDQRPSSDLFDPFSAADEPWDVGALLYRLVTVRVGEGGRLSEYDAGDTPLARGDTVTVESDHGPALGEVMGAPRRVLARRRWPRVLRRTSDEDVRNEANLRRREHEITLATRHAISTLQLPMKLIRVALVQGGNRAIISFRSEARVDYRELLRRLAASVRVRVELRQIGARDAAAIIGGVGPCGLQLCCNTFLKDFAPVSIKMAKDQGLSLTPQRISGVCGRLLCCLVYEEAFYRQQRARYPKIGRRVITGQGPGKVRDVDVLGETLRVALETGELVTVPLDDLRPLPTAPTGKK